MVTVTREITVPVYERSAGTFEQTLVGWRTATVTLTIDADKLFTALGGRALKLRSGQSTQAGGRIVAKVHKGTITFKPKAGD